MNRMKSAEIRRAFIQFFENHQHTHLPSSALIPQHDPTLLFVNAGMVQFKDVFLGQVAPAFPRVVSVQRCVRAGGKHNDLDQVGYTARHHTLFEMLGNFSFGDYFKRDAICLAWTFLTEILKLPEEKLWITVYESDQEAEDIWFNEIGISKARFSRCGAEDNFWSMGETGPCGPCSEIFYDHGPSVPGGPPGSKDAELDRYVEIWNLVFMQYNRDSSGVLHPLEKPSVDTGMGLERISAVMQGVHSNYDTDIFIVIKKFICSYLPHHADTKIDLNHPSLNVIADHIRAIAFLMMDGVMPSNEGRGYVLRRIIRRAVRHGHHLKLPQPFLTHLVQPLAQLMEDAYPELKIQAKSIEVQLLKEEVSFAKTLSNGLNLLSEETRALREPILSGDVAFKLYDTYGFPLDLTQDILRERGIQVDEIGFEQCMQKQRDNSKAKPGFGQSEVVMSPIHTQSVFEGYEQTKQTAKIGDIRVLGQTVERIEAGTQASIVLDKTPFYAESGGQAGDHGYLVAKGVEFIVEDTQQLGSAILHHGVLQTGQLACGDLVEARIDEVRRDAIRLNHTATHLLHAVLKQILGESVEQKGSLVEAKVARFDFSYDKALTQEQTMLITNAVNAAIRSNDIVQTEIMDLEEAKRLGAQALFGEKYQQHVRVLTMGSLSKELCGGTHANRTGDLGLFVLLSEFGVAQGVRRIEFATGAHALTWMNGQLDAMRQAARILKAQPEDLIEKVNQLQLAYKAESKALEALKSKQASQMGTDFLSEIKLHHGIPVLIKALDKTPPKALRSVMDAIKSKSTEAVIVLIGVDDDKVNVVASVDRALLKQGIPNAPQWVQAICGRGGGREDMAQGGGTKPEDLDKRIKALYNLLV